MRVRASLGASVVGEASVTITVQDPAEVFAGALTACGSAAADFSGCPTGATQDASLPSGFSFAGKRVLLRRGESFARVRVLHGDRGVIVGAFGAGAKPRVAGVEIGTGRPPSADFPADITIMDLDIADGVAQHASGSRILLYRNDLTAADSNNSIVIGSALEYWAESDPWALLPSTWFENPHEIFVVENHVRGSSASNDSPLFGTMARSALLGNDMAYAAQHTVRIFAMHQGVIAHNAIRGQSSDGLRHALKLHSGGFDAYDDNYLASGSWATRQVVIADNLFGDPADNNQWTVAVTPQNGESAEGIEDVIVENNRFVQGTQTVTDLTLAGRRLTYRGNARVDGGPMRYGLGAHGDALPLEWRGPYYSE